MHQPRSSLSHTYTWHDAFILGAIRNSPPSLRWYNINDPPPLTSTHISILCVGAYMCMKWIILTSYMKSDFSTFNVPLPPIHVKHRPYNNVKHSRCPTLRAPSNFFAIFFFFVYQSIHHQQRVWRCMYVYVYVWCVTECSPPYQPPPLAHLRTYV